MSYAKVGSLFSSHSVAADIPDYAFNLETNDQKHNAIMSNKVCVIDMYASWCGPCKAIYNDYNILAKKLNNRGRLILCKENVEKNLMNIGNHMQVSSVPCFLFFVDGKFRQEYTVSGADLLAVENHINEILSNT